jgi:threonine-phosphate decarboxylase
MPVTHGGAIFAAARDLQCDWRDILDFSASINPLGPSPSVRPALLQALDEITHYPDPYATRLQMALAREWDVDPRRIFLGNGATELIHFLARVWHIEATLITPVFSEFHRAYPQARLNEWPEDGLVVVSNPVNPTGSEGQFRYRRGWTLIDESFLEFTDLPTRMHEERCLVLRSLTKFHALPGLRVGALVGPFELMDELRPAREPWQVNVLAEAAALAAIADKEHQRRSKEFVAAERHRLWEQFSDLPGVDLQPTHANYYLAKLRYRAQELCEFLYQRKVLIRDCTAIPGVDGESVRFAVRSREDNERLLELWRTYPCD